MLFHSPLFAVKNKKNIIFLGKWLWSNFNEPIEYQRKIWAINSSDIITLISVSALKHWKSTFPDKNSNGKKSRWFRLYMCVGSMDAKISQMRFVFLKQQISPGHLEVCTKLLIHQIVRNFRLAPAWIAPCYSWQCCYRGIVNSTVNFAVLSALRVSINIDSPRCDHEKTCMIW